MYWIISEKWCHILGKVKSYEDFSVRYSLQEVTKKHISVIGDPTDLFWQDTSFELSRYNQWDDMSQLQGFVSYKQEWRQKSSLCLKKKKKSLSSISSFILTLLDPSELRNDLWGWGGASFPGTNWWKGPWCIQAIEYNDFLLSDLTFIYFSKVTKIWH